MRERSEKCTASTKTWCFGFPRTATKVLPTSKECRTGNGSDYKQDLSSTFRQSKKEAIREAREMQDESWGKWCVVRIDGRYVAVNDKYLKTHGVKPVAWAYKRDRLVKLIHWLIRLLEWLTRKLSR